MTGNIMWGNTILADLSVSGITGLPGLGLFRLVVVVGVSFRGRESAEPVTVSDFTGDLYIRGASNVEYFAGRMWHHGAGESLSASQHPWSPSLSLEADLDPSRIEAIEELRKGRDLNFRLWLYARAFTGTGRVEPVKADLYFGANQSAWVEALDRMNYRKTLLLEIPMPDANAPEQLRQAVEHLQHAQDLMIHGRYREAVGACRDVLESLETALGDAATAAPDNQRDWDKACRVRNVRRALKVLTHPARHADQVSARHEWGPEDAASIVTATAALLRLATQD